MQFSQIAFAFFAAGASAAVVARNGGGGGESGDCNSITVCSAGGKSYCQEPEPCKASGGDAYCCFTNGLVNVLDCTSILSGNTVSISIPISGSLPITL